MADTPGVQPDEIGSAGDGVILLPSVACAVARIDEHLHQWNGRTTIEWKDVRDLLLDLRNDLGIEFVPMPARPAWQPPIEPTHDFPRQGDPTP